MIKKLLPFCCLIILLTACKDSSTNSEDSTIATIDLSKIHKLKTECKSLSDFVKDTEYIKLETKKGCLLGDIQPLHIGNKFVIICKNFAGQVFLFQRDGKFIGKIGQYGRGPGEYLSVRKAFVFPDIKEIHLYSGTYKKILRFDYNLKHIGDINMDYSPTDIEIYQNKYYICAYNDKKLRKNGGNDLIVRDPVSFKKRKVLFKRDITNLNTTTKTNYYPTRFIKKQDTLYYISKTNNKKYLYSIFQDKVKPVFYFKDEISGNYSLHKFTFLGEYIYIHIQMKKNNNIYSQYYNPKTKTFSNYRIINDIDKGDIIGIDSQYDGEYKEPVYTHFLTYNMKHHESDIEYKKRKCKFPEKQKMLKEYALNGENDNPWIMLLVPKD